MIGTTKNIAEPSSGGFRLQFLYHCIVGMIFLIVFFLSFFPVSSDDLFMYLAIGRRFFQDGKFPAVDPFLFTRPEMAWNIMHEWGTYLVSYKLYSLGGLDALIVVKTGIMLLASGLAYFLAVKKGYSSLLVPALMILGAYSASARFIERASLTSDFFTPAVLAIILLRDKAKKLCYFLPFIFLIWVNVHPGFLPGLALLFIGVLFSLKNVKQKGEQVFIISSIFSVIACLINPRGIDGFLFPFRSYFSPTWKLFKVFNYEWMPTLNYLSTTEVRIFILLVVACFIILMLAWKSGKRPFLETIYCLFFLWLGFSAIRFVPVSAFCFAVLSVSLAADAGLLPLIPADGRKRKYSLIAAIACTAFCAMLLIKLIFFGYTAFSGPRHFGTGINKDFQPVNAAEFIENIDLKYNLFNQHDYGSYLAWRWDGRRKLFYHGFADDPDLYGNDYLAVNISPERFEDVTNRYNIGAFLLASSDFNPARPPLIYRILLTNPDWRLVYMDNVAMVFLKNLPGNVDAINNYQVKLIWDR